MNSWKVLLGQDHEQLDRIAASPSTGFALSRGRHAKRYRSPPARTADAASSSPSSTGTTGASQAY